MARRSAIIALGRIVPSEESGRLEHGLDDDDWQVRLAAVNALQQLLPNNPWIVNRIACLLGDPKWEVRQSVAQTLERFGDTASVAVFPLISALDDDAPQVREAAAIALGEI